MSSDYNDVTLISNDNQVFQAHRIILGPSSPYFATAFKQVSHSYPTIILRGVSGVTLSALINFIYKGVTEVDEGLLDEFLNSANDLEIRGLETGKLVDETENNSLEDITLNGLQYNGTEITKRNETHEYLSAMLLNTDENTNMTDLESKPLETESEKVGKEFITSNLHILDGVAMNDLKTDNTELSSEVVEKGTMLSMSPIENKVLYVDSTMKGLQVTGVGEVDTDAVSEMESTRLTNINQKSLNLLKNHPVPTRVLGKNKNNNFDISDRKCSSSDSIQNKTIENMYEKVIEEVISDTDIVPETVSSNPKNDDDGGNEKCTFGREDGISTNFKQLDKAIPKLDLSNVSIGDFDSEIESMIERKDGFWNCLWCGKEERNKGNLKNHAESNHTKGFSHICIECTQVCAIKNALNTHIANKHRKI